MSGLVWAAEAYYEVLGSAFYVQAQTPELAEAADRLLAPFRRARCGVPGRRRYSLVASTPQRPDEAALYRDCSALYRDSLPSRVLGVLVGDMNATAVDCYSGFAVHAGVVTYGERTLAFPAKSGVGKSTLVAACLLAGFDYVSDEALCFDYATGLVVPYPKAVKLSAESFRLVGMEPGAGTSDAGIVARGQGRGEDESELVAADLGARWAEGELRLSDVVLIRRGDQACDLRSLPTAEVVALLLGNSFNHYKRPRDAFDLVTGLARSCRAWQLDYGDPLAAAALLMDRVRRGLG